VKQLTSGVEGLVRSNGADVVFGTARLVAPDEVEAGGADGRAARYGAERRVLGATGRRGTRWPSGWGS